jgi:hypothetical protein
MRILTLSLKPGSEHVEHLPQCRSASNLVIFSAAYRRRTALCQARDAYDEVFSL